MGIRLTPAERLRWEPSADEAAPAGTPSLQHAFESDWREALFTLAADKIPVQDRPSVRYCGSSAGPPAPGARVVGGRTRHDGSVTRGQGPSEPGAPRRRARPDSLPNRGRATLSGLRPIDAIERKDGTAHVPAEQHVIVRGGHPATVEGGGQLQQIAGASSGCVT